MVIKKTSHSQICSSLNTFCLPRALLLRHMKLDYFAQRTRLSANRIYAYSAEASLNGNVFAQPYQNDTGRIRQRSGISVE